MRYRSNNILALIPPVKAGENILNQALFFRQKLDMHLFIYHIIHKTALFKKLFLPRQEKLQKNDALNTIQQFVNGIVSPEQLEHITFRIKSGSILPVLIKQSKIGGYEFIILDKDKAGSGLEHNELDKLVSFSKCPVMILTNNFQLNHVKKIFIPVDVSQSTQKKLLWATYFAKKFDAQITIVSALGLNIQTKQSLAWRNAEKLKYILKQRGIKSEVEILKATGQEKHSIILDYINKEKPDLVIIRTHQEANLSGSQIGNFVSEIIHGCTMPVFTVTQFMHPMPIDFEL